MSLGSCYSCGKDTDLLCPNCERYYCINDASIYNKRFCLACGPHSTLGLEVTNVTDPKTQEPVRHFKLIGEGWPNEIEKIYELTDLDLGDKILHFKQVLKEVVKVRDTLMITLSAMENEYLKRRAKSVGVHEELFAKGLNIHSDNSKPPSQTMSEEDKRIKKLATALHIDIDKARLVYDKLKGASK